MEVVQGFGKYSSLNNTILGNHEKMGLKSHKKYLKLGKMENIHLAMPKPSIQVIRSPQSLFKPELIKRQSPASVRSSYLPSLSYALPSSAFLSRAPSSKANLNASKEDIQSKRSLRLSVQASGCLSEKPSSNQRFATSLQAVISPRATATKGHSEISKKQQEEILKLQQAVIEVQLQISDYKKKKSMALMGGHSSKSDLLLQLKARQLRERLVKASKLIDAAKRRLNKLSVPVQSDASRLKYDWAN